MSSTIEVRVEATSAAEWFSGVTDPNWFVAYDTIIDIDGTRHAFSGGQLHEVPCPAGDHKVSVYFFGRKLQGVLGLLRVKTGLARTTVHVPEDTTVRMRYLAKYGWTTGFGRSSLSVIPA